MRRFLIFVWFLLPVAAGAYHYGPGQERVRADRAAAAVERGENAARTAREIAAREGDDAARAAWSESESAFAEALELIPAGNTRETRAIQLERAKAQMYVSQLPEARRELGTLVDEMTQDPSAEPKLLSDARSALANAQYYTTWLMRLEGAAREEWEPEIEASRQNYKLVAESSASEGDPKHASESRENLESSIRLARAELKDLQGLPLPSQ